MLVALYLAAIVAANLSVVYFGPTSIIVNAFLFIGLDLTTRDLLHERWEHKHLWTKMGLLIASGSALSWMLNRNAGPIAIASLAAFAAAGVADTVMYQLLGRYSKMARVNGSNVLSAAVDSVVFPTLAFGSFMPWLVAGQFVAKVAGGFLWSLILRRYMWNRDTARSL